MNCLLFRLLAPLAAAAFALLLACTPDEQPPTTADAAVDAAPDSADAAPADAGIDVADAAPVDATADAAVDAPPEVALPQCASASDCPTPGPCWLSTCTSKGTCALAPTAAGTPCDDGNACSTQDQCGSGLCAGTAKLACDDENACTIDKCNPYAGCLFLPAAASSACDDGDPCTQGDSCQQGQCEGGLGVCQCKTTSDCAKFEDGDLCNGTLYCDKAGGSAYTCKVNPASVVSCSTASNSACQTNTCVASTGQCKLVVAPGNTPCSDGEACTTGDFCDGGQCQGGTNTCYCKGDSDCKGKEDGNLCNGTLFCNKATAQCQVNPASVVTCQTVDETACLKNLCNPKEGKCHLLPLKDGMLCDDGNPCTPNEACSKGECSSAVNTCECQKDADCLAKEDGNLCNGTLYCDSAAGKCRANPVTVVSCATGDDPACLADVCDPKTGKCSEIGLPKDGTACDDGNSCTALSFCQGGLCQGGANLCECQKDGDCAVKEDGNLCNGKLFCNPKSNKCEVNPATVVECPGAFDEECLTNQCDPATGGCGMKPAHQGNQCGGQTVCSAGGWCNAGECQVEGSTGCECQKDSDCSKLEDGDLCNGTLYCNKTLAKPLCQLNPASVVVCQTVGDSACSQAQCQPASGACKMVALTGSCSDGLACTEQDGCSGGACKGSPKACVDSLPCTADSCAEPFGCLHLPTSVSVCDDGNACTAGDACLGGKCTGTVKTCEDGNPCTTDSCHGEKGCQFNANSGLCSDGNPCTQLDLCKDGACIPGVPAKCDDGNLCTADGCDPASGSCKFVSGGGTCADSNPCTDEVCDPKLGCTHLANQASCNDGNACTTGDVCASSNCGGVGIQACDDGKLCTQDSCDPKLGCVYKDNPAACDDGDACTIDTCGAKACLHQPVVCDDGNPCTVDSCAKGSGQCLVDAKALDGKTCDADGDGCTVNDTCFSGACKAGGLALCKPAQQLGECEKLQCSSTGAKTYKCALVQSADGDPCAGQNACYLNSICQKAQCVAGSDGRFFSAERGLTGQAVAYAAAAFLADGYALAGRATTSLSGGAQAGAWLIDRATLAGKPAWPQPLLLPSPVTDAEAGAVGIEVAASGAWFVAGTVRTVAEGRQIRVLALDPATHGLLADQSYGLDGADETVARLAAHPAGGYVVVGARETAGKRDGLMLRLSSAGVLAATWNGGTLGQDELRGVLGSSDGSTIVCGATTPGASGKPQGWLVKIDASGNTVWSQALGDAVQQRLEALDRTSDGGLIAAGWVQDGNVRRGWWVRTLATGKVLWQKQLQGSMAVYDLRVQSTGGYVGAGVSDPTGQSADAAIAAFDAQGLPVWQRLYDAGSNDGFARLALGSDGGVLAAGTADKGGLAKGLLLRGDAWGHPSCPQAGLCAGKMLADCADTNPCSDDLCDAASGCAPLASEKPCEDGDACTKDDVCQGGTCAVGLVDTCEDGNSCTADACDKVNGCSHVAQAGACPDDTVCTQDETCAAGVCKVTQVSCDDLDPCTQDSCDALEGCKHDALIDETACGATKVCVDGKCIGRWAVELAGAAIIEADSDANSMCARHPDGTVSCWGKQFGPTEAAVLTGAVQLANAGGVHCGLRADGAVWCWGGSAYGGLGLGLCSATQSLPTPLVTLPPVKGVFLGGMVNCAKLVAGQTWCWGDPNGGGLGNGTCGNGQLPCVPAPKATPELDGFVDLAMGYYLNCGRKADGTLWCWGGASKVGCKVGAAYPGDGSTSGSAVPVQVAGLIGAKHVSVGVKHACAVTAAGGVVCWGSNVYGEIGDGSKIAAPTPVTAYKLNKEVVSVAAGLHLSCAVRASGTVACWGLGVAGQMGNGTINNTLVPQDVPGLTGVKSIATSYHQVCALKNDGSVWCWGQMYYASSVTLVPTPVTGSLPK